MGRYYDIIRVPAQRRKVKGRWRRFKAYSYRRYHKVVVPKVHKPKRKVRSVTKRRAWMSVGDFLKWLSNRESMEGFKFIPDTPVFHSFKAPEKDLILVIPYAGKVLGFIWPRKVESFNPSHLGGKAVALLRTWHLIRKVKESESFLLHHSRLMGVFSEMAALRPLKYEKMVAPESEADIYNAVDEVTEQVASFIKKRDYVYAPDAVVLFTIYLEDKKRGNREDYERVTARLIALKRHSAPVYKPKNKRKWRRR